MQDTHDLAAFRQGIRDFVRQRLPDDLRQTVRRGQQPTRDQLVAWHDVLAGEGLLVPHWPETWGGRGTCSSRWSSTRKWRWATRPS